MSVSHFVVCDRSEDRLNKSAEEITKATGRKVSLSVILNIYCRTLCFGKSLLISFLYVLLVFITWKPLPPQKTAFFSMLKQVFPVRMDVRKADDVATAVDKSISEFGLPDLVLNNAAGNFISPTERLSPNAFATIIGIVLQGTANVTLDIGKRLIKEKKGDMDNYGNFFLTTTTKLIQEH